MENKWLLFFFVISLIAIILCIIQPFYSSLSLSKINAINNASLAIATGYASGYIIYFLSVIVPKAYRMAPILSISKDNFRYARDVIGGFFLEKGGPFEINKKEVDDLILFLGVTPSTSNEFVLDRMIISNLHEHINKAQSYLQFVISQADYLDDDDIVKIKDAMTTYNSIESRLSGRIKSTKEIELTNLDHVIKDQLMQNSLFFYKDEVTIIIKDLQGLYETFDCLYQKYEDYSK